MRVRVGEGVSVGGRVGSSIMIVGRVKVAVAGSIVGVEVDRRGVGVTVDEIAGILIDGEVNKDCVDLVPQPVIHTVITRTNKTNNGFIQVYSIKRYSPTILRAK